MKNNIYYLFGLALIFLTSCDCMNSYEGRVVSMEKKPINDVKVYFVIDGVISDSTKTDSSGYFKVNKMSFLCNYKENDVIFIKEGLQPLILSETVVSENMYFIDNLTYIKMHSSKIKAPSVDLLFKLTVNYYIFNIFNILVVIFNILTLIYVFKRKEKFKILWAILIIIGTPCIFINTIYWFCYWNIFGFILSSNLTNRPWLLCLSVPAISIIFWIKTKYYGKLLKK